MALDIGHQWGADFDVSANGDLAVVAGPPAVTQRVLRRLLTNPGDYIWNIYYGAGLPKFVGGTDSHDKIAAIARSQMLLETAVENVPPPEIIISGPERTVTGTLELTIRYGDRSSGQRNSVTLPIMG